MAQVGRLLALAHIAMKSRFSTTAELADDNRLIMRNLPTYERGVVHVAIPPLASVVNVLRIFSSGMENFHGSVPVSRLQRYEKDVIFDKKSAFKEFYLGKVMAGREKCCTFAPEIMF